MMKQCGLVQAISVTKRERQQTRPQVVVCPVPNRSSTDWRSARFLLERTKTASAELFCTTSVPDPACAVRHIEVCVMSGHDCPQRIYSLAYQKRGHVHVRKHSSTNTSNPR